jgi:phage-related protein
MSDFRVDGNLTADVSGFVRSIREARDSIQGLIDDVQDLDRELRNLNDRRVNVRVDIDGADEIRALREDLDRLSREEVNIRVNLHADRESLRSLRRDLEELSAIGDQRINVRVDVDGMSEVERLLAMLIVLTGRRWTIDLDIDGIADSIAQLLALRAALTGVQGAADGAGEGMSGAGGAAGGMIGPILTLLPLFVALAGVMAGVGAGIFGAMATAGIGVAVFGALAMPTFKKVMDAAKKGEDAIAKLPEPMQVAARNLVDLKNHFEELQKTIQPVALEVFAEALNVARVGLDQIAPVAKPAGEAIRDLLANMAEGLKGDQWTKFFTYLRDNTGWFIRTWGVAVGNFITGIANMIVAFDPLSKFVSRGFLGMSESFLKWTQSLQDNKQFQEFVQFVITNGPIVFRAIMQFVGALLQIAVAMAPIGAQMLSFIAGIISTVAAFMQANPQVAAFIALLVPLIGFVLTLWPLISGLAGAIAGLSAPVLIAIAAIAAIIAIIMVWWTQCESFRKFVKEMWQSIGATFSLWIGQIKAMIQDWLPAIVALWNKYGQSIMDYIKGMWIVISGVISGALRAIRGIVNIVLGLLTGDWKRVWNGIKQVLSGVWVAVASIVRGGIQAVRGLLRGLITAIGNIFKGVGNLLLNAGRAIVNGLKAGISGKWGELVGWFKGKLSSLRDMLPFSPAKKGPFSGRGYTTFSGAAMIDGLRKGMASRIVGLRQFMQENLGNVRANLQTSVSASVNPKASSLQTAVAAGASGGVKTINFHEGAFKVYNPAAETASDSTTKTMQKVGRFGIFEN